MKIKALKTRPETAIKIFEKHNVFERELYEVLNEDNPIFKKVGGEQYIAIGFSRTRYITLFFRYYENEAELTTAYPSTKNQIKHYKSKVK